MMNYNFLSAAPDLENLSVSNAAVVAVLGYAVVFLGLIALMLVVMAIGKVFTAHAKQVKEAAPVPAPVAEVPAPVAPGSAGELKMHNVEPRTAALLMAIVADKMGKPLSELRFISIREVE